MHVEFKFHKHSGPELLLLRYRVVKWATRFDINYTEHTIDGIHCVMFEKESKYTIFALTWPNCADYRIVSNLNNKI